MAETRFDTIEGGLWGCIVVAAAFFIQVIAFGTSQSIGIYNVELLQYFDAGAAAVSLCGSINLGLFLGAGPLSSILMTRWTCRQIALVGAVLANIGIITMPFAPNLPFIYVFYGIISGLGYCLLYVPSHVLSGLYFYKQRSCSTGIATAGSGMGASIFPVMFYHLIDYYGWRGSFFIVAGLNLNLFVFAALLRPVPKTLKKSLELCEKADQRRKSLDMRAKADKISKNDSEIENSETDPLAIEMNHYPVNSNHKSDETLNDIDQIESRENIVSEIENHNDNNVKNCDKVPVVVTEPEGSLQANCRSPMLTDSNAKQDRISIKDKLKDHCLSVITFDFISFCLSNIFWNAGGGILLIFLPEYMINIGISKEDSSIAFTAIGIGACVGCVTGGVLGNVKCFNRIVLYIGGNLCAGLGTLLMVLPYFHYFISMFTLALLFGFMFGIILGLLVVVTSDLLGTGALSDGFGYLMFCNGVGIFGGPPLAGVLIDQTGHLGPGMIFSAVLTMMGGVVMGVVPIKRRIWGHVEIYMETEVDISV